VIHILIIKNELYILKIKMGLVIKYKLLLLLQLTYLIIYVNAEFKCYSCVIDRSSSGNDLANEIYSGIQKGCKGEDIGCNIFGAACDFCWSDTKYYNDLLDYCSSDTYKQLNGGTYRTRLRTWHSSKCGH
jgi:hypothetical protein